MVYSIVEAEIVAVEFKVTYSERSNGVDSELVELTVVSLSHNCNWSPWGKSEWYRGGGCCRGNFFRRRGGMSFS